MRKEIMLETVVLILMVITDWNGFFNGKISLLNVFGLENWYRILFYIPLIISIQTKLLDIPGICKYLKLYFWALWVLSFVDIVKSVYIPINGSNISFYLWNIVLKTTMSVILSVLVFEDIQKFIFPNSRNKVNNSQYQ